MSFYEPKTEVRSQKIRAQICHYSLNCKYSPRIKIPLIARAAFPQTNEYPLNVRLINLILNQYYFSLEEAKSESFYS